MNTETGVIVVGDQTIGYTERLTCLRWDIPADVVTERSAYTEDPFYLFYTTRYSTQNYILTTYSTRWTSYVVEQQTYSEKYIILDYAKREVTERHYYYYPDSANRFLFVQGLLTNTPLLLKYPKYFNWNYIPQIVNPRFDIWSFYPLEKNDLTLKIVGSSGTILYYNYGISQDSFLIEEFPQSPPPPPPVGSILPPGPLDPPPCRYRITVYVNHVFENEETINCYLTVFDSKGNYLKDGMW